MGQMYAVTAQIRGFADTLAGAGDQLTVAAGATGAEALGALTPVFGVFGAEFLTALTGAHRAHGTAVAGLGQVLTGAGHTAASIAAAYDQVDQAGALRLNAGVGR